MNLFVDFILIQFLSNMVVLRYVELLMILVFVSCSIVGSLKIFVLQMGWNSYNNYVCEIDEDIIFVNVKGLVELGLFELGYEYVIFDCGWYNGC